MKNSTPFLNDLVKGFQCHQIWMTFGWIDIKLRYRRTFLGPLWVTISFICLAMMMTGIYSILFGVNSSDLGAFIISGLAVWTFISSTVSEACSTFISASGSILERKMPLSVHVYRQVFRNLLVFLHYLIALVIILPFYNITINLWTLFFFPGVVILIINSVWVSFVLGMISTRYRDIQQLTSTLITMAFYLTPIFWKKEMLGSKSFIADINPFYHLIEIVRYPILGEPPPALSWAVSIAVTAGGLLLMFVLLHHFQKRIAYWL